MQDVSGLPTEIKKRLCNYLDGAEVTALSMSNKTIREDVALSKVDVQLVTNMCWERADDVPTKFMDLPVHHDVAEIHSVELHCTWRDQSFGNRKGQLFVVAEATEAPSSRGRRTTSTANANASATASLESSTQQSATNGQITRSIAHSNEDNNASESIDSYETVWTSPIAPHSAEPLTIRFPAFSKKRYMLWYKVGHGGGHRLVVSNLFLRVFYFDDPTLPLQRGHNFLAEHELLGRSVGGLFFQLVVHTMTRFRNQIQDGQPLDADKVALFESFGLKVDSSGVLVSALLKLCESPLVKESIEPHNNMKTLRSYLAEDLDWYDGGEEYDSFGDEGFILDG